MFLGFVVLFGGLASALFYKSLSDARADVRAEMIKEVEQEFTQQRIEATLQEVAQRQIQPAIDAAIKNEVDKGDRDIHQAAARILETYRQRTLTREQEIAINQTAKDLADDPDQRLLVVMYQFGDPEAALFAQQLNQSITGFSRALEAVPSRIEATIPRGVSVCVGEDVDHQKTARSLQLILKEGGINAPVVKAKPKPGPSDPPCFPGDVTILVGSK